MIEFFGRREIRDMFAEIFSYDRELIEQGVEQGFKRGIEQGIEQGVERTKLETAKKLLVKGMSIEDILEITELPEKEIEQLIE